METKILRCSILATVLQMVSSQAVSSEPDLTVAEEWGYGMLTGIGVSLIGFAAAICLVGLKNCLSQRSFLTLVNVLYSLGCGALLGDAAIHILPEAFRSQSTNPRIVSLIFVLGIVFFLVLERIFDKCGMTHSHWGEHAQSEHGSRHSHQAHSQHRVRQSNHANKAHKEPINQLALISRTVSNNKIAPFGQTAQSQQHNLMQAGNTVIEAVQNNIVDHNLEVEQDEENSCFDNLKGKGSAGYLNLFSSFIHNFMDGFGIGVGFASGMKSQFVPIIIAICAHEIPRQMGDVAILMKNKFSSIQTILCNGFINLNSLVGVIIGLAIGNLNQTANQYTLVLVASNFIYIAADIWRHLFRNTKASQNILEALGLILGIAAMFLVLLAESS